MCKGSLFFAHGQTNCAFILATVSLFLSDGREPRGITGKLSAGKLARDAYSYLIDLAGWMCDMRWLGPISTNMQASIVAALMASTMGKSSSMGAVLT